VQAVTRWRKGLVFTDAVKEVRLPVSLKCGEAGEFWTASGRLFQDSAAAVAIKCTIYDEF